MLDGGAEASVFDGAISMSELSWGDGGMHVLVDLTMGSDGNMWVTENYTASLARISPQGDVVEIPTVPGPDGIVSASDQALWVSTHSLHVGRVTVDGGTTVFDVVYDGGNFYGGYIAEGADSNLWITGENELIGRMAMDGGSTLFDISSVSDAAPAQFITPGPGGLWFNVVLRPVIGRIALDGTLTSFPVAAQASAIGIGADGNVWYSPLFAAPSLVRMAPDGGAATSFTLSNPANRFALGPDGNLWFTENVGKIGRCTPAGVVSEFDVPTSGASLGAIARGPGNTVWFIEQQADKVVRVTLY